MLDDFTERRVTVQKLPRQFVAHTAKGAPGLERAVQRSESSNLWYEKEEGIRAVAEGLGLIAAYLYRVGKDDDSDKS